jgi:hypothetical protein
MTSAKSNLGVASSAKSDKKEQRSKKRNRSEDGYSDSDGGKTTKSKVKSAKTEEARPDLFPPPGAVSQANYVPLRIVDWMCLRRETVERLWALCCEHDVVHVRGTPATGKSTLASLLFRHAKKQGKMVIFLPTWDLQLMAYDLLKKAAPRCPFVME